MMDGEPKTSFSLSELPAIDMLLQPLANNNPRVNDAKIRRLYLQASSQQWFSPQRIDFSTPVILEPQLVAVWSRFMTVFYTLEKMGLQVIGNMYSKAVRKMNSQEAAYYLAAQQYDEARHVFTIEQYLKRMGTPPQFDRTYFMLGRIASMGVYQIENWLFSTLFSENFASCFLRMARTSHLDDEGKEMCRSLLIDESRHIHFLHIVLPDMLDRMSFFGKTYLRASGFFMMKLTEMLSRRLDVDALAVGINRKELVEEVFENVEKAYESFGLSRRFVPMPKISPLITSSH